MNNSPTCLLVSSRFFFVVMVIAQIVFSESAVAQLDAKTDSQIYFPSGEKWESADSAVQIDSKLKKDLFAYVQEQNSTGILVLVEGKILIEEYFDPAKDGKKLGRRALRAMSTGKTSDGKPIEDVASVQKSITSVLVGIAIQKGQLSLGHPVSKYVDVGWSKASPEQELLITIISGG